MSLAPGTQLGGYEILARIGAGGMGEVYRARDPRLQRDVAIKVLAPEFVGDPDRIARFRHEAIAVAALNHPNIAAIHEFATAGASEFLVLELVDGLTIAERIAAGPLPLKEALHVAKQITYALEAAHERGIIHRDLKPANIKITPDGVVKVLDFGLAKMRDPGFGSGPIPGGSDSPTLSATQHTAQGIILGTAPYMSPEQARGTTVDKRTDVWAFGCVLYEMLTGRHVFDGGTVSDTIARILERDPDWTALPSTASPSIRRLLRRCLEKDAVNRTRDIGDARIDISEAISAPDAAAPQVAPRASRKERLAWLGLASALAAIASATALFRPTSDAPLVQFPVLVPEKDGILDLAVSPDGRHIAFGTFGQELQLSIRNLDSLQVAPLLESNGGFSPFWSPDGASIGFFTLDGKLKKTGIRGGTALSLCDLPTKRDFWSMGGTWNTAGDIVFSTGGEFYRVSADGGTPEQLDLQDQPQRLQRGKPSFLPDGRHFLYRVLGSQPMDAIYVGSIDDAHSQFLTEAQSPGVYAEPGHLLFVRGDALIAQPFNPKSRRLTGEPVAIGQRAAAGVLGVPPLFSLSKTGTLAFGTLKGGRSGQLAWFDRARADSGTIREFQGSEYLNPSLSPDGRRLAANRMDPQTGNWDIWNIDLQSGIASRLTADPAQDSDPVWSPDGREIVFASRRGGVFAIYRTSVAGSGQEQQLVTSEVEIFPTDWSADGRFVLFNSNQSLLADIFMLPLLGERKPQLLLHGESIQHYGGRLSPDGKWIAYSSTETGHYEVYVQSFMPLGKKVRVSRDGGIHPRWRADGRELYFWNLHDNGVYAVDIAVERDGPTFGSPVLISPPGVKVLPEGDDRPHYDITRDGKRLLLRTAAAPAGPPVTVMLNWIKALEK